MLAARFKLSYRAEHEQALAFAYLYSKPDTAAVGRVLEVAELAGQLLAADDVEMQVLCNFVLLGANQCNKVSQ